MEKNKNLSEMSVNEILRQQLELLAERSIGCTDEELSGITKLMLSIADYLLSTGCSNENCVDQFVEEIAIRLENAFLTANEQVKAQYDELMQKSGSTHRQ